MDGWMNGWMDGWMDEWLDGWMVDVVVILLTSEAITIIFN